MDDGGKKVFGKLQGAIDNLKRLSEAQKDYNDLKLTDPSKRFARDVQKATANRKPFTWKKETVDDLQVISYHDLFLASGAESVDALNNYIKKASKEGLVGTSDILGNTMGKASLVTQSFHSGDSVKRFVNRASESAIEYATMIDDINELIEAQNNGTALNVDSAALADLVETLGRSFYELQAGLETAKNYGFAEDNSRSATQEKMMDALEGKWKTQLNYVKRHLDETRRAASLAGEFKNDMEIRSNYLNKQELTWNRNIRQLKDDALSRDFIGFSRNLIKYVKEWKHQNKQGEARNKLMSSIVKSHGIPMMALFVIQAIIKVFQQVGGMLLGINNIAAEFNTQLTKAHGIISQGLDVRSSLEFDHQANFNKYRSLFKSFGVDSGSFIDEQQLMEITSEYEKMGIKLRELTANSVDAQEVLNVALNMSARTGLSLQQVAQTQANWRREFGMTNAVMAGVMGRAAKAASKTGVHAQVYLEGLEAADHNFNYWAGSLYSLLGFQEKIMGRKDLGQEQAKTSFQVFNDYIKSASAMTWSNLATRLPHGEIGRLLAEDEERARKAYEAAETEDERAKAKHVLQKIAASRAESDPTYQRLAFAEIGTMESKIQLLRKSLSSDFDKDLHEALKVGVLDHDTTYRLKNMLGFSGSDSDWEALKIALSEIVDPSFDVDKFKKEAEDAGRSVNQDDLKALGDQEKEAYMAQAKMTEMFERMIQKYTVGMINAFSDILDNFRKFWRFLFRSDYEEQDPAVRAEKERELKSILDKIKKEKDPEKRELLVASLMEPSLIYMQHGGDPGVIKTYASENKVGLDVLDNLDKFLVAPDHNPFKNVAGEAMSPPSGGSLGTSPTLSEAWKNQIRSLNPAKADEIIRGLESAARKSGIAADMLAAKINQETHFRPRDNESGSGAMGIAQFMPETARQEGLTEHEARYDIVKSLEAAASYAVKLKKWAQPRIKHWSQQDQMRAVWSSYNTGPGNFNKAFDAAKKNLGRPPSGWHEMSKYLSPETQRYIPGIEAAMNKFGSGAGNTINTTPSRGSDPSGVATGSSGGVDSTRTTNYSVGGNPFNKTRLFLEKYRR